MMLFAGNHAQCNKFKQLKQEAIKNLQLIINDIETHMAGATPDETTTLQNKKSHCDSLIKFLDKIRQYSARAQMISILEAAKQKENANTSVDYRRALAKALNAQPTHLDQILRGFPSKKKPILPDWFYDASMSLLTLSGLVIMIILPVAMHVNPSVGLYLGIMFGGLLLCGMLAFMQMEYNSKNFSYENEIDKEKLALINESSEIVDSSSVASPNVPNMS